MITDFDETGQTPAQICGPTLQPWHLPARIKHLRVDSGSPVYLCFHGYRPPQVRITVFSVHASVHAVLFQHRFNQPVLGTRITNYEYTE